MVVNNLPDWLKANGNETNVWLSRLIVKIPVERWMTHSTMADHSMPTKLIRAGGCTAHIHIECNLEWIGDLLTDHSPIPQSTLQSQTLVFFAILLSVPLVARLFTTMAVYWFWSKCFDWKGQSIRTLCIWQTGRWDFESFVTISIKKFWVD